MNVFAGIITFLLLSFAVIYTALVSVYGFGFYEKEHTCTKCDKVLKTRKELKKHMASCSCIKGDFEIKKAA